MPLDEVVRSPTMQIAFGPFHLLPYQRLLLKEDEPVSLGSRAVDILTALVERPGELVTRAELMRRAWPDTVVVPANLTVHIAALRKALGDTTRGPRYLLTVPGRGYRFVAPIVLTGLSALPMEQSSMAGLGADLPAPGSPGPQPVLISFDAIHAQLSLAEQRVFRRLAVFAGAFTSSVATAIVADADLRHAEVGDALVSLAAKSFLAVEGTKGPRRFRLPCAARAYALAKLLEADEHAELQRRHAEYYRAALQAALSNACDARPLHLMSDDVDDVRAALSWAFSSEGDTAIGIAIALAAVPFWDRVAILTAPPTCGSPDRRPNFVMYGTKGREVGHLPYESLQS